MDIDLEELAAMVELLKTAEFSEFCYEKGDLRIVIRRDAAALADNDRPAASAVAPAVSGADRPATRRRPAAPAVPVLPVPEGAEAVTAPLLGTFYGRPKPGEAPFVKVGDRVEADTVLCIVEVMKLMNSVHAGCAGVVVAVHAEDGQLVEFGQPLFSIASGQG